MVASLRVGFEPGTAELTSGAAAALDAQSAPDFLLRDFALPPTVRRTRIIVPNCPELGADVDMAMLLPQKAREKLDALIARIPSQHSDSTFEQVRELTLEFGSPITIVLYVADALQRQGMNDEAIVYYDLGRQCGPHYPVVWRKLVNCFELAGKPETATECSAIELQTQMIQRFRLAGEWEMFHCAPDQAVTHFARAVARLPDNEFLLAQLGELQYLLGDYETAAQTFKTVLALGPSDLGLKSFEYLSRIQFSSGAFEDARESFANYLTLCLQNPRNNPYYGDRARILHGLFLRRFTAIDIRKYCKSEGLPLKEFPDAPTRSVTSPRYSPPLEEEHEPIFVHEPPAFLAEVHDADVIGHEAIVCVGDKYLVPSPVYSPGYREHRMSVLSGFYHESGITWLNVPGVRTHELDEAALVACRNSDNYFHFLFEDMTRYIELAEDPGTRELPVIFSHQTLKQGREMIELIAEPSQSHVFIKARDRIHVKRLLVPSVASLMPDDPRMLPEDLIVGEVAVRALRRTFLPLVSADAPRRLVFLRRANTKKRNCVNEPELAARLESYGFESVDPGALSFREQLDLFANTKFMVCSGGAAMSNVVWMRPDCKVICLFKGQGYDGYIFNSIARLVGVDPIYVRGEVIEWSNEHIAHRDFYVPEERLMSALERLLAES